MPSTGSAPATSGFSALGSYSDGQGGPDGGMVYRDRQPDPDSLVIVMTHITPQGEEAKAIETRSRRR